MPFSNDTYTTEKDKEITIIEDFEVLTFDLVYTQLAKCFRYEDTVLTRGKGALGGCSLGWVRAKGRHLLQILPKALSSLSSEMELS